ncbi:hypothetical protein TSMEX_006006 [Taenia solium]|eukprot:TsM_000412700 transcript=TsM_000412700 gene=TsM_000412700
MSRQRTTHLKQYRKTMKASHILSLLCHRVSGVALLVMHHICHHAPFNYP